MTIKTVGIKKLKDNLSGYLKEAISGTVILITDRDRVIAQLHEPVVDIRSYEGKTEVSEWIRDGKLFPPRAEKAECPVSFLRCRQGISSDLLDGERAE